MKKKVALLLVLVMILSALPMNAFGLNNPNVRIITAGTHIPNGQEQNIVLEFNGALFQAATSVSLVIQLGGFDGLVSEAAVPGRTAYDSKFASEDAELGAAPTANDILHNMIGNEITISSEWTPGTSNDRTLSIDIVRDDSLTVAQFNALNDPIRVLIPATFVHNVVNLSGALIHGNAEFTIPSTRLTRTLGNQYLAFSYPEEPQYFTDVLRLRNITVTEGVFGNFGASNTLVRLEAPNGYEWHLPAIMGVGSTLNINYLGFGWGGTGAVPEPTAQWEFVNHLTRHVFYVQVDTSNSIDQQIARSFEIRGLVLVPAANNNSMGDVSIHIATVGSINTASAPTPGVTTTTNVSRPTNDGTARRVDNLLVGRRVGTGLVLSLVGEELPELRTGSLNEARLFSIGTPSVTGSGTEYGLRTATVEVRELAPGFWGHILGDRVDFTFEQDGVAIVGAAARAGRQTHRYNIFNWSGGWLDIDEQSGFAGNRVVTDASNHGRVTVTENVVSVVMPPMPGDNAQQASDRVLTEIRRMEVTFWISIVAGFEAANPNTDIYVTVSGPGAAGLAANNRTLAVATPVDPVSLRLLGGAVELGADMVGDTIANRSISDIEITIYEPHLLRPGQTFELFISGTQANQQLGLHMYANRVAQVSGNGLALATGVMGGAGVPGVIGGSGISFQITQIPDIDDNNGPVTITISGVLVSGTLVPDVQYYVVLAGSAVAENVVVERVQPNVANFVARPYSAAAISNRRAAGGTNVGASLVISTTDVFPGVVGAPLAFQTIAGANVGLVSLRAFANLIGSTADDIRPDYPTAGQHTILGRDVYGRNVQVTVASGSTNVTVVIDGITHQVTDLASWAGPQTGVAAGNLPVVNIGGNVFLPFRAMANIFGYDVEMVTAFSVRFFS